MATTKSAEYATEIKNLNTELTKTLNEFKGFGAGYNETKNKVLEIQENMKSLFDAVSAIQTDGQKGCLGPVYKGGSEEMKSMMDNIRHLKEGKAAAVASPSSGGYLAVPQFYARIEQILRDLDPMWSQAEVIKCDSNIALMPYEIGDSSAHWVGERESRNTDDAGTIGMAQVPMNRIIAKIKVTDELLSGAALNLEQYLINKASDKLNRSTANAFVIGDGNKKPEGLFASTKITTKTSATKAVVGYSDLLDLYSATPSAADARSAFYMSKGTIAKVAAITDLQDRPLWMPSMAPGLPPTILGFPVYATPSAPAVAGGNKAIGFGDLYSTYKIFQGDSIRYIRDDVTGADSGEIYIRFNWSVGGQVVQPKSFVTLTIKSS